VKRERRKTEPRPDEHLFSGQSPAVQRLAKQAHKEARLKKRAEWWTANQQRIQSK
jgi:hypothetical protein